MLPPDVTIPRVSKVYPSRWPGHIKYKAAVEKLVEDNVKPEDNWETVDFKFYFGPGKQPR